MKLKPYEQEILDGKHGSMKQKAIQVLLALAEHEGVEEFVEVSLCHSDNAIYMGEAASEFVAYLGESGVKLSIPTTTNACSIDTDRWYEQGFEPYIMNATKRMEAAHAKMGAVPTWTCAPYQSCVQPIFGQQIVCAESNVVCYYNSVIGARTNRYGGPIELLGGIVGRVPYSGLHVKENRYAKGLIKLSDEIQKEWFEYDDIWSLIAYAYGVIAGNKICAIEGIPKGFRNENLRDFSATAASSGGIAMFHMIGITPEAQTIEMAFGGKEPQFVEVITLEHLKEASRQLSKAETRKVDAVLIGCPHCSFDDCTKVLSLIGERRVHSNIEFNITVGRDTMGRIKEIGLYEELTMRGVKVYKEGCALEYRMKKNHITGVMSNSGKFGTYCYGLNGIHPLFGSLKECVETAIAGELIQEMKPWRV